MTIAAATGVESLAPGLAAGPEAPNISAPANTVAACRDAPLLRK